MKASAKMVIMSHLSDVQELVSMLDDHPGTIASINRRINFAKFVLLRSNNVKEEVDADELYKEFCEKYPE